MTDISNDPADYEAGGRLDPDADNVDQVERDRRRAERDRVQRETESGKQQR